MMMSRCSSPIPEMMVCPLCSSVRTVNVGSSSASLARPSLRVPRPAALEPVHQRSGYGWQDGLAYYREVKDDCTLYHFFSIPRGTYRVTEDCYVERNGRYHTGVATIQCVYAQEYSGHSADQVLQIR